MPELPEVETIRQDLRRKVLGSKIQHVEVMPIKTSPRQKLDHFQMQLAGKFFTEVERVGKLLIFCLNDLDSFLLVHLKMTGQLIYVHHNAIIAGGHSFKVFDKTLPSSHTRAIFTLDNGAKLFFNDSRRFGYLKIVDRAQKEGLVGKYGLEPLQPSFTLANFAAVCAGKKTNVKAILLNQERVAGIGNIYADEALHRAGILPDRSTATLSAREIKKLFAAIQSVIGEAIRWRGTTFNNYVDSAGNTGNFSQHLKVYDRSGEKCLSCKTGMIEKTRVAGRGTHFCKVCQK